MATNCMPTHILNIFEENISKKGQFTNKNMHSIKIIDLLHEEHDLSPIRFTIHQKGIILVSLTALYFQELNAYHRLINNFEKKLISKYLSSHKRQNLSDTKKRARTNRKYSVTKRKEGKRDSQRQEVQSIEQLLEKELESNLHSQAKDLYDSSQATPLKSISNIDRLLVMPIEMSPIYSLSQENREINSLLTPVKDEDILEECRHIVKPTGSRTSKKRVKFLTSEQKTRKKLTQQIKQEMNDQISFDPMSQMSRTGQIKDLLNKTKCKRQVEILRQEHFLELDLFHPKEVEDWLFDPQNLQTIDELSKKFGQFNMNNDLQASQAQIISDPTFQSPQAESFISSKSTFDDKSGDRPNRVSENIQILSEIVSSKKKLIFNQFIAEKSSKQKSQLFYALMCSELTLQQKDQSGFGSILILS